ncbi:hypothetical protein A3Q34_04930 [Colwellia sp. PAMC 20917]|uniref:CRISPR-associated ring nuclease Csm6 n=1 Tax=Colwellia sp. PAMC 20917 TaxID=1816218 RepID=UPI0008783F58|nr:CRISPR-associated ring nuclease Csm6 [Colwellia sp. PAMC 20917]AOW76259.1 hypothetical protein A3Q34_04930 [Colwellia sp. PAMC 20917]
MKKNNILLAVTGMSPQVVTETIYALYVNKNVIIDEIQIITTSKGRDQAWISLGMEDGESPSQLTQLCNEYNLPPIKFTKDNIFVIPDSNGKEVADARNVSDHNALADYIINHVRELTEQDNVNIFASLAGGRKTMTFFMGYAMSLFGRAQDSLSHVLVTEEFENVKDFFYPTLKDKRVTNFNNISFNAKNAEVTLAEIPFVRMRDEMPDRIIKRKANYTETIELMNVYNETPKLEINLIQKIVKANNINIPMANAEIAFLAWFANLAKEKSNGVSIPYEGHPDKEYAEAFKNFYEIINNGITEKVDRPLRKGMDQTYFNGRKTNVKSAFNKALGKRSAENFILQPIQKIDENGTAMLYGLKIAPENITLITKEPIKVEPVMVLSKKAL